MQFLGNVSYSLYLWHWPLIVLSPFALGHDLTLETKIVILVLSILLAVATKFLIEDPVRKMSYFRARRPGRTFVLAAIGMVAILTMSGAGVQVAKSFSAPPVVAAESEIADPCLGAAATDRAEACPLSFTLSAMTPAFAKTDTNDVANPDGTWQREEPPRGTNLTSCLIGEYANPAKTIALLGDSHMGH